MENNRIAIGGQQSLIEKRLAPLRSFEATCRAFDKAEEELVKYLGVPICIPGCGKCCEVMSVTVWDVEANFILSWLIGLGGKKMQEFLSICEGWLLDHDAHLTTYGIKPGLLTKEQFIQLKPQVDYLISQSPCPMLTAQKECLVYDARPWICRAYAVTRMPGRMCNRPLSRMESSDIRGHISTQSHIGATLKKMVIETLRQSAEIGWGDVKFLATAIFMAIRPEQFNKYVFDGKIATAKIAIVQNNMAILFQDQLNDVWSKEIAAAKETAATESGGSHA